MSHRAGVILVAVVCASLLLPAVAYAGFLPLRYARGAAEKDARERASSLVGYSADYGVDRCARQAPGRVSCKVHAHSAHYAGTVENPLLREHKLCRWTVVAHLRGASSLVYYFDKGTTCRSWISESSQG